MVPLLQFFFWVLVVSYVTFVVSLFLPHLFYFWCLGRAMLCNCGISWVSSLIFFEFIHIVSFLNDMKGMDTHSRKATM